MPAVSETNTTIESVLQEGRVFDPPAEFAAKARVGSLEAYQQLACAAKTDPECGHDLEVILRCFPVTSASFLKCVTTTRIAYCEERQ